MDKYDDKIISELTLHILNQFDAIKDKYIMTYDDFKAFSLGYTLGIYGTLKATNTNHQNTKEVAIDD